MKAAAVDRFGPPSALTLHELPVPRPGPHEVVIAIDTAGVGSWDASIRNGSWRRPGRPRFPLVPGVDGSLGKPSLGEREQRWDGWYCGSAATVSDHEDDRREDRGRAASARHVTR